MAGGFKRFRQRFGISAPRVAVRTHVPWYLRWLLLAVLLAFSVALAAWMYDAGHDPAHDDEPHDRGDDLPSAHLAPPIPFSRATDREPVAETAHPGGLTEGAEHRLAVSRHLAHGARRAGPDNL